MIKTVGEMINYKFQKAKVEEMILNKGHKVMLIHKSCFTVNLIQYGVMQNNALVYSAITHLLV